jgi:xanthine dehydrogenase large subunit
MLAFSVREALRAAAGAFGPEGHSVELASPATPEAVFWAVEAARAAGDPEAGRDLPAREPRPTLAGGV